MMSRARSNRPDTVASLKRMLAEKEASLAEKEALLIERDRVIAVRDAELYAKTLQIEHMRAQLAVLRRARFGRSSEKLDREIEQLELVLGELEEGVAESNERAAASPTRCQAWRAQEEYRSQAVRSQAIARSSAARARGARPPLACSSCSGTVLRKIGEDVTEVLEYVPSSFKVIEHVRRKLRAGPARRFCKRRCRRFQSSAVVPGPHCSRMSSSPSLPMRCRCTGRRRSINALALIWTARQWRIGSAAWRR